MESDRERAQLEREVLKQFRVVVRSIRKHFQEVERACGVSGSQIWALSYIGSHPGARVSALAKAMTVHQSTASNLVERLVELGLVMRARSARDHRVVELLLSDAGKDVLSRAPGPFQGVLPEALSRLPLPVLEGLNVQMRALLELMTGVDSQAQHQPLADL